MLLILVQIRRIYYILHIASYHSFLVEIHYMKVIARYVMSLGANEIQWAYRFTLEKNYMSFYPKKKISYKWIFEQLFLQIVIINA
jgi:hypothetical protein